MASVSQVRAYLAYWFQLGKPVVFHRSQTHYLPCPIFRGHDFSHEFEHCWQRVAEHPADYHLKGTDQTVADLLTEDWDITGCARCTMPVPMPINAVATSPCPCHDVPAWPNHDVPLPRIRTSDSHHLANICTRLANPSTILTRLQSTYASSPDFPRPSEVDRSSVE